MHEGGVREGVRVCVRCVRVREGVWVCVSGHVLREYFVVTFKLYLNVYIVAATSDK